MPAARWQKADSGAIDLWFFDMFDPTAEPRERGKTANYQPPAEEARGGNLLRADETEPDWRFQNG